MDIQSIMELVQLASSQGLDVRMILQQQPLDAQDSEALYLE